MKSLSWFAILAHSVTLRMNIIYKCVSTNMNEPELHCVCTYCSWIYNGSFDMKYTVI